MKVRPMATNIVKAFPRGYSGGQSRADDRFATREGDERVHDLFVEYTNFPTRTVYWEFRKKVIDLALVMFQGRYNWFIRQDTNAQVKDYNYEFLLDTVRYIATGRRRMDIHTWPMLVASAPTELLKSVEGRTGISDLFKSLEQPTGLAQMLQAWVSHPKGFDDLMYTMNLLFGKVPVKVQP